MSLQSNLKRNLESTMQNALDENDLEQNSEPNSKFLRNDKSDRTVILKSLSSPIPEQFFKIISEMNSKLKDINFSPPVDYIYNPTEYAFYTFSMYINKYCSTSKKIMFLGMNPGPWGMVQTGVPFGEISFTRDWLKITGKVNKPLRESKTRPVKGFECNVSEISGQRFWKLFKELCGTPEKFFNNAFLYNYCPLAFLKTNGTNFTPAELNEQESNQLTKICDEGLFKLLTLFNVEVIVGIGRYAENRAKVVIKEHSIQGVQIFYLLHPSPRVPNNENWKEKAKKFLKDRDLVKYFQ